MNQLDEEIMKKLLFRKQAIAYIIVIVGAVFSFIIIFFFLFILSIIISVYMFYTYTNTYHQEMQHFHKSVCQGKVIAKHSLEYDKNYYFAFGIPSQNKKVWEEVSKDVFEEFQVGDSVELHKLWGKYRYGKRIY